MRPAEANQRLMFRFKFGMYTHDFVVNNIWYTLMDRYISLSSMLKTELIISQSLSKVLFKFKRLPGEEDCLSILSVASILHFRVVVALYEI